MTSPSRLSRARLTRLAVALLVSATAVACGSDDKASTATDAATDDSTASTPTAATDSFPVTVTHAFGESVVPTEPKRVVVAGLNEADYLYSLGVAPVGVHEWWGEYPYATGPWADATRVALGAEPEVLEGVRHQRRVGRLAGARPDRRHVPRHRPEHVRPPVRPSLRWSPPPPSYETWGTPWREQLRLIAGAVGRTDTSRGGHHRRQRKDRTDQGRVPELRRGARSTPAASTMRACSPPTRATTSATRCSPSWACRCPPSSTRWPTASTSRISSEQFELLDQLDTFIWLDDTGKARGKGGDGPDLHRRPSCTPRVDRSSRRATWCWRCRSTRRCRFRTSSTSWRRCWKPRSTATLPLPFPPDVLCGSEFGVPSPSKVNGR